MYIYIYNVYIVGSGGYMREAFLFLDSHTRKQHAKKKIIVFFHIKMFLLVSLCFRCFFKGFARFWFQNNWNYNVLAASGPRTVEITMLLRVLLLKLLKLQWCGMLWSQKHWNYNAFASFTVMKCLGISMKRIRISMK